MNFVDISLVLCSPFHSPSNWTQSSLTLLTIHIHFNHPLSILCHLDSSHLTLQRHQLHGGHAQGWGRPRLGRQVHAGRRVRPWEDVQVCDDDDDLTWHECTGLASASASGQTSSVLTPGHWASCLASLAWTESASTVSRLFRGWSVLLTPLMAPGLRLSSGLTPLILPLALTSGQWPPRNGTKISKCHSQETELKFTIEGLCFQILSPGRSWWGLCLLTPAPGPGTEARETPWWGSVPTMLPCFPLSADKINSLIMFKLSPTKSLMAPTDYWATL